MRKVGAVIAFFLLGLMLHADIVLGQPYPSKTVRIVTDEAGGNADTIARLIGSRLSNTWGQSVVVENRINVIYGGQIVSRASPDGYTLLIGGTTFWIGQLFQEMPFNPVKDFSPVTLVSNSPVLIVILPTFPAASVKDLIALAKAKPGALNYGTASTGSAGYLAAELLKSMAKINMVRVQYKGAAPSLTAALSGEVQMSFASVGSAMPYVTSGRLKALAVTSAQPSATAPGVPTVASYGMPGYEVQSAAGVFTTLGTPKATIDKLNRDISRIVVSPEMKEKFLNMGSDVVGNTPEQFAASIKSEVARLTNVVKEAGVHSQ